MARWGTTAFAGVAVALLAVLALAQEPPPTFGAGSEVVLLDLVARDGKGRVVPDLRQDEIQVSEDGKRAEVVWFRLVRAATPSPEGARTTASARSAGPPAVEQGAAAPAEPATPSRANLVVLLFDRLLADTAPYAREGALKFLQRPFPPNTWFAVFKVYTRGTQVLQPFTADAAKLRAAVLAATTGDTLATEPPPNAADLQSLLPADASPGSPQRPDTAPPNAVVEAISASLRSSMGEVSARVQAFDSLYGLTAIARSLETVRGRKTILYLAADRELPDSTTIAYDSLVSAANRANVTIHTIDVRGLTAVQLGDMSLFGQTHRALSAASAADGTALVTRTPDWALDTSKTDAQLGGALSDSPNLMIKNPGSSLERMANDTGGLSIRNTNDLGAGLARATEELTTYYELAYVPPNPTPDGRFRRIHAKVTRPGVHVRTRAGYFATPRTAPSLVAYELPLIAALGSNETKSEFPHTATVLHFGGRGAEREAVFLAEVPLSHVQLAADEARGVYRAHLQLLGIVKDESGRAVARVSSDWPIEGALREQARAAQATALFRRTLTLPPGRYALETALQDAAARRLSLQRGNFEIPPAEPTLAVGSLSVVHRAQPSNAPTDTDPLSVGGVSIQPELTTPVMTSRPSEIPLFLPIYPVPGETVTMQLELWRSGERVAQTKPALPSPAPDGRIAWIGTLPAKSLPTGRYEVVAIVSQGSQTAEERTAFELRSTADAVTIAGSNATASPASPLPPVPPDLVPVLERAAQYVTEYENQFRDLVAEEDYTQWVFPDSGGQYHVVSPHEKLAITLSCTATMCRRKTRADLVFVRLSNDIPWGTFRDVFEVDGNKLRDHESRLEALFTGTPSAGALQRARALLDESARYNIGPAVRNINFPTLALAFLHPRNQARFAWKRGGKRRFGTVEGVEVEFDELARPTLVDQDGKGDLPAKGRFWIDPVRGTVLRSETTFRFEPARAKAYVAVEYRPEPKLAMWVPSEMREEYQDVQGTQMPVFRAPSEATARYSNFRRFSVTTEETAHVPGQ